MSRIAPARAPAVALTLALVATSPAAGQCETRRLTAHDAAPLDRFGESVALAGDRALLGAVADDGAGADSGSAYVFERSAGQWIETAKLTASDAAAGDAFGFSVALSGEVALVGAIWNDDAGPQSGAAYVFEHVGAAWVEVAKLTASDASPGDKFGAVALDGGRIAVGARDENGFGEDSGAVYVFERQGGAWLETAKLTAGDAAAGHHFGRSVSVAGDTILVGAGGNQAAYVFVRGPGGWSQTQQLAASDGTPVDNFGNALSLDGERAVVGAVRAQGAGSQSGAAYVFERTGGTFLERAKLVAGDAAAGDSFGVSVAIDGGRVLVGSVFDDDAATDTGSAYLFEPSGPEWVQTAKLVAQTPAAGDRFGFTVAVSGARAVVGGPADPALSSSPGFAQAFELAQPLGTAYCLANANSTGAAATLTGRGRASLAAACLQLTARGLPPERFGYFLLARTQGFVPLFGGSQGNLCLALPIVRFDGDLLFSGAAGEMHFTPDLTSLPQGTRIQPGETWNFQLWYRDRNPDATSNTSPGLAVAFES